jgi:hypothetical protein
MCRVASMRLFHDPLAFARGSFVIAGALLALNGCPAPEPAKDPPKAAPLTEADARRELDEAKTKGDPASFIAVYNKFPKFAAGKTALRLGARKYFEKALEAAEACDQENAGHALAKVAPYTTDDSEIDEAYDETKNAVIRERKRCQLIVLDADVKKAESNWDYAKAFDRIMKEKDADGIALHKRRVELTARWSKWLDATIKEILAKKSIKAVVGDKREAFDAATDASKLPEEAAAELEKRAAALAGIRLVFDKLEGGVLLDPPVRYWTYGSPKSRHKDTPGSEGAQLTNGVPFVAVAKGKLGGVALLVAGASEGDTLTRLGSIKLLIPEADSRTWDTNVALPEKIVGARVLAPIAAGSDQLSAATVVSEDGKGSVVVQPKHGGNKLTVKKTDLRGLAMSPGMKVIVMINGKAKPGELADAPEEDRALVRMGGFENYFPLGDIRVKRSDLPKPPAD